MPIKYVFGMCMLLAFNTVVAQRVSPAELPVIQQDAVPAQDPENTLLAAFNPSRMAPEWLAGTVDIDFSSPDMSLSVKADMRFRRDSLLWLNIKKLGFAVARIKITRDSIWVINYLDDSYMALGMAAISEKLGFPISFDIAQGFILGQPLLPPNGAAIEEIENTDKKWQLSAQTSDFSIQYMGTQPDTLLRQQTIVGKTKPGRIVMTFDDYERLPTLGLVARLFAFERHIGVQSPDGDVEIDLTLDSDGLEVNVPKNIKFDIPSGYKKKE